MRGGGPSHPAPPPEAAVEVTLAKATAVVEAAEENPQEFDTVVAEMDETGKVEVGVACVVLRAGG